MLDCITRLLYLKHLYFKVGQTVLSRNYDIFERQIDYTYAEKIYKELSEALKSKKYISICDKNGAFFNLLSERLLLENFSSSDTVFCTLSPFYIGEVIDYIFIPSQKLHILNNCRYDDFTPCSGYIQTENSDVSDYNFVIANEFFEKSQNI